VGSADHRAVAHEAVRQSLVLLKNETGALPLAKNPHPIHVAGIAADDIGLACGGWTIEWQGQAGPITEGSTLLDGLRALAQGEVIYHPDGQFATPAEVGIVVVSEPPYAEGYGDSPTMALSDEDRLLIWRMRQQCDRLVLVLYSGRPLIITNVLETCDAIVAAWLPGSEAGAIAGVLFGETNFSGKLPFTWPRDVSQLPLAALRASGETPLWPFGFGLRY
jgi:beta-glucosidase